MLSHQIHKQTFKLMYIALAILISIGLALGLKLLIKRYITDNERTYTANKIINFFNITIIVLILLFAYLENVTYLVAVLGFAYCWACDCYERFVYEYFGVVCDRAWRQCACG